MAGGVMRSHPFRAIRATVEALAFWTAIVLPLAYVPALLGGPPHLTFETLLGLLGLHLVTIVLGHGYGSEVSGSERGG